LERGYEFPSMSGLELEVVAALRGGFSPESGGAPPGEFVAEGNGSKQPIEVLDPGP